MELDSVGEVIATRELELMSAGEAPQMVQVTMGKPHQLPEHTDYYCPYEVKGSGFRKVRYACGIDAFQALQLALQAISVELEVLNKELNGRLRWECGREGDFGFPDS